MFPLNALVAVVLLVSCGACSFEEKARTAMAYRDFVQYLVVYDDRMHLVLEPLSTTNPDGITIGLLFVSETTGLRKFYI